jgi:hypothetical protein
MIPAHEQLRRAARLGKPEGRTLRKSQAAH